MENELDLQQLIEELQQYIESSEGQQALQEVFMKTLGSIEMFRESRKISWELLNTLMIY